MWLELGAGTSSGFLACLFLQVLSARFLFLWPPAALGLHFYSFPLDRKTILSNSKCTDPQKGVLLNNLEQRW